MNWTPERVLDARGSRVVGADGVELVCRFYPDGWEIRRRRVVLATAADIWAACRVLNDHDATVVPVPPP